MEDMKLATCTDSRIKCLYAPPQLPLQAVGVWVRERESERDSTYLFISTTSLVFNVIFWSNSRLNFVKFKLFRFNLKYFEKIPFKTYCILSMMLYKGTQLFFVIFFGLKLKWIHAFLFYCFDWGIKMLMQECMIMIKKKKQEF